MNPLFRCCMLYSSCIQQQQQTTFRTKDFCCWITKTIVSDNHLNRRNMSKMATSPKISLHSSARALVICGPSGSGKTTLLEMLLAHFQTYLKFSVSHTTRKPRPNENDGQAYYFVDRETFENMIKRKEFVEYSVFSGNYYGTSYKELSSNHDKGLVSLLDVDIRGVISLKRNEHFNAKYIFIKPPSLEFLERNLRKRGTETDEIIAKRLNQALEDMKLADTVRFDLIIENIVLDESFETLKTFVKHTIESSS